jgi:hypothetical protein
MTYFGDLKTGGVATAQATPTTRFKVEQFSTCLSQGAKSTILVEPVEYMKGSQIELCWLQAMFPVGILQ